MTLKQLEILLKDLQALPKECEWAEFKIDNSNPQEIGEYLSALSNSACYTAQPYGYLVFGVEDSTHRLVGTNFHPLSEKKGNQELENWLATQLTPRIDFRIFEFKYNDLFFAIFRVDATRNTPVNFRGTPYIRIGSYKKSLDDHSERERKIWNYTNRFIFEKEIALEDVTEDRILQLLDYPGYFDLMKLPLPDSRNGIIARLEQDRLIVKQGNNYSITNLGGLLFAKDIEQFEALERKAVRVILYQGNNRIKTKREQIGKRGYAVGFSGLIRYTNEQLPSNETIGQALRQERFVYPPLAVRELIANAIIHQDFSVSGTSPLVEIFDNRVEITNPGKPLIDPLRFVDHSPESRNELLARFMRAV